MAIEDEAIKTATSAVELVGEIIKAAGDNPEVKEAGKNLGKTALTVAKIINNALLPIAAVNFAFDKARIYFAGKFQQELSQKTSTIPPELIVEPKASIAGPVLQGLAFTHEEVNLKDMYLNLLTTAMDGRVASEAHPAFVEIIKQLDSEEASIVSIILQCLVPIAIVEVQLKVATGGSVSIATHMLDLSDTETLAKVENPRIAAMVDNWIRLGLVKVDYLKRLQDTNAYEWVSNRPEVARYKQVHENDTDKLDFAHGIIQRTALGIQFAKAVGLA